MGIFTVLKGFFPVPDAGDDSERISAAELMALIDGKEKLSLIDVRTPGEHGSGHIPGSISIPLDTIKDHEALPNKGRVVLYCASGVRSVRARKMFSSRGIPAVDLKGGINAWMSVGGKVASK